MPPIDLAILGAGPAGLSTALHLLQIDPSWGERLVVLDKAAHPRPKLCAGGVTPFGLSILRTLGFELPLPLPQVPVHDARMVYGKRVVHVRGRPQFVVYQRAAFDAFLAGQARQRGVRLLENTPVQALAFDDHGVTITTPTGALRARAVVGADGSKGLSRRVVQARRQPSCTARLLEVVTPAPASAPQFQERYAIFDFTPSTVYLQGYVWEFPSRPHGKPSFNRGIYDARFIPGRPRARLPDTLAASLRAWGADPQEVAWEGHPIHWFSPRGRFARPHLLLVGDAAGADPLFGEGIAPALGYGRVAARTLHQAFMQDDLSFQDYRARLLTSPVGRYLLLRWAVAWWGYRFSTRPWFMHTLWTLGGLLARSTQWMRKGPR